MQTFLSCSVVIKLAESKFYVLVKIGSCGAHSLEVEGFDAFLSSNSESKFMSTRQPRLTGTQFVDGILTPGDVVCEPCIEAKSAPRGCRRSILIEYDCIYWRLLVLEIGGHTIPRYSKSSDCSLLTFSGIYLKRELVSLRMMV